MNKLDYKPETHLFSSFPTSQLDPTKCLVSRQRTETSHRLIVLFPPSESDSPSLERRIWEIARSLKLDVLFISLTNDFDQESQLRRKLVTMAAIIKDPFVSTEIMIEHGSDWVGQIKKIWRTGDIVACYAGQRVGLMRKSLDQVLRSSLETTIYIIADYQPVMSSNSTYISRAIFWLSSIAIIAGFLWAEVKIIQLPPDWTHTALIYMCILVEVVMIYIWSSLFP